MEPDCSLLCSQEPSKTLYGEELLAPHQPPSWRITPQLLIQYLYTYPPYLEAVSYIHNLRTYHAMVTVSHLTQVGQKHNVIFFVTSQLQKSKY